MKRHAWALGLVLALGCGKDSNPTPPDAGGNPDGGPIDTSAFAKFVVDSSEGQFDPISSIAMAVGPQDRIGMAYFVRTGTMTYEVEDSDLMYREFNGGQLGPAERIATVQRVYGVSVAFGPDGQPVVTYLGGGSDDTSYWFQSDLAVSYRSASGAWTERIVVRRSDEAQPVNPALDQGFLVGLNPAIVFSGSEVIVAYRDGKLGSTERQSYASSDLEVASGGPTTWQRRVAVGSGDTKLGYGGHIAMVMAGAQPALVHDKAPEAAHATGTDVHFQRRNADGLTWTPPVRVQAVPNTQLGASLAHDSVEGFGIAVLNRNSNALTYTECADTSATSCTSERDWSMPDPVFNSGTGGWYPSLAFDPVHHEPSIAFYICAAESSRNDTSCNPNDDALVISTRIQGIWREMLVDAGGGWSPKLAYLSNGKRVVLYRAPVVAQDKGVLKLAVER
ncbi:hypothetical protein [Myxococcus xanthus]|uniref:Lipoprotein n=1 Tax=Myxococcus xanthus TaxID=34 RepID=A0AAE6FXB6_MYXXA|nr:hypothetical protein [Myxococcus xanthus]QDE66706.1 hypothetical protein BHS09_06620 [Myxococcus xanthus]QDE73979.1 hypothetical protein BHS08_06625 [Myxococcus xanthus]QDE95574.1 hypothetical protein BHS05_06635 [Myxococcus xanthus]